MACLLTNNARSTLATSVSATSPTLIVRTGHGSKFPSITESGDWFPIALEDVLGNIEFCKATARTGDSITVERAQEGTLARSFLAGDACELRLTVAALKAFSGSGGGTDPDPDPDDPPTITVSDAVLSSTAG